MAKIATQIRLEEDTYSKLKRIAELELRSLNAQMEYFIIKGTEQFERENPAIHRTFGSRSALSYRFP